MFRALVRWRQAGQVANWATRRRSSTLPVVQLDGAKLYREYPSPATEADGSNAPVFSDLSFSLAPQDEYWAVVSPASVARTSFLQTLGGKYICLPPTARSYPYLLSAHVTPEQTIKYVGFDAERGGLGGTALKGAHLSARYESHREVTDWSVRNYLEGNTELNALEKADDAVDRRLLDKVIADLNLRGLLEMPVSNLSNGQTRRARIAKALLTKPQLLLLDGPFMGLDPVTQQSISLLLRDMAHASNPRLVLSLRPEDRLPDWLTHVIYLDSHLHVLAQGEKDSVFHSILSDKENPHRSSLAKMYDLPHRPSRAKAAENTLSRDAFPPKDRPLQPGEPIVEMQGVRVSYRAHDDSARRTVLGDWSESVSGEEKDGLWWTVHRGERWAVFGPNGSGKTTLLSLITSDHPQTYGLPIRLFGRSRIPEPGEVGISIFELQSRMGHSSPEVHTYFPKHLSVRRVLESAWADAPLTRPRLTHQADRRVDSFLRWFAPELAPTGSSGLQELQTHKARGNWRLSGEMKRKLERLAVDNTDLDWADSLTFRDLSFSSQRLLLFLRALVAGPDLVILDEALSGMDEDVRDKCLLFLSHGEKLLLKNKNQTTYTFENSIQADNDAVTFSGLEERQALLTISHSKEDVPGCVRQWICLPEPGEGKPARRGSLTGPLELNEKGWYKIWALDRPKSTRSRAKPDRKLESWLEGMKSRGRPKGSMGKPKEE